MITSSSIKELKESPDNVSDDDDDFFKLTYFIYSESQSKVIKERIDLLETCMGNLCENFGKIARKNARLRDTSDNLVTVINQYSGKEKINSSTKKGLVNYSSYLSTVEDYRHAMVSLNLTLYLRRISF